MAFIKRYTNRKLYDCDERRYITLEEIAAAVRRGEDVQIVDHASGVDLTTLVLAQALLAEEKRLGGLLPQRLLTRLIRAGESSLNDLRSILVDVLDRDDAFEREFLRRLQALVTSGQLPAEEARTLCDLILTPDEAIRTSTIEPQTAPASQADIQALLAELSRLEIALDQLK